MPIYTLDGATPILPASGRYYVAPGAHVIGRVELGEDANIWFGATLRGDGEWIRIGARSNVQDGSVIHTDRGFPVEVGEGCTLGHSVVIHGCTIGNNSLIGMGATVLNGARIGNNSLVGANALVTEGKEFPDNVLIVGAPAKVVRVLDEEAIERLKGSATRYVENGRRFAAHLREIEK